MSKGTLQSIREQSEKLHNRWMREFAGKPRHTRDLVVLEKLLEKAAVLARKAKQIPGDKGDELEKIVRERLKLYTTERDAIAEVQFVRPEVGEMHTLSLVVDRVTAMWRRHYAGRDRRTRDLALLEVLVARLGKALARLGELVPDNPGVVKPETMEALTTQLEVMKDERSEIDKAKRGVPAADRPALLLTEAAQALDRYRVLIGGQPRASCALANLDAVIATLRGIELELRGLTLSESQVQNLGVVAQNLAAYTAERDNVARALAETSPRDRGSQLASVANGLFELYQRQFAGQPRGTRDLKLLSDINDRLTDVAELMAALVREHDEPFTKKNLAVVDERVKRYEAEWVEIAKAKAQAALQQQQKQAGPAAGGVPSALGMIKPPSPALGPPPQIRIEPKK